MKTRREVKIAWVTVLVVIVGMLASVQVRAEESCNADVQAYLKCNNPTVIDYLAKLKHTDVGKKLSGVHLSDGAEPFKGATFLGQVLGLDSSTHVYVIERNGQRAAFAWIDVGGKPLPLPKCPKSISFESTYVLSGDVYTYIHLRPGDGVVEIMCVHPDWRLATSTASDEKQP